MLADIARGREQRDAVWLAKEHEAIVGYCQHGGERFGPFGVAASHRGRGIGLVLLSCCLERMKAKGYHNAWFMWGGERNSHLYKRVGFVETRRYEVMKKELL